MKELAVNNIFAGYGGTDVLRGLSLRVAPGDCVAVLGPNGAGKSTLLKVLSGQIRVRAGSRTVDGRDVTSWKPYQAARDGIRWVGEPRPVYPSLTVEENLAIGGVTVRGEIKKQTQNIYELLPALHAKRRERAGSLSGGQQQMLAIAQALMSTPRYLCLDEPSLGLAPAVFGEVARMISDLATSGVGVVWAEQFAEVAKGRSSHVVVLSAGTVVASGAPTQISDDQLQAAYFGASARRAR